MTQAVTKENWRGIYCFHRKDGSLLWKAGVVRDAKDPTHETNPYCSASPVTDGEVVVASYASGGVFCYTLEGRQLWMADLGPQSHGWGHGPSPILHENLVIVYHGPGPESTMYALDKKTGKTVWKSTLPETQPKERFDGFAGKTDGQIGSFSTPLLVKGPKGTELVLSLPGQLRAFHPSNGQPIWNCDGLNPLIYTSPIAGEGIVVAMGGYFGGTVAVRPGGSGDVTESHRIWFEQRAKKHRIGSGVIKDGHLFISNTLGIAECIELSSGRSLWEERLKASGASGETWGSVVRSGERLFVVNQSGDTMVFKAAKTFELLGTNPLGEPSNCTPAFSNGDIFIRTHQALWCIRETPVNPASR